MFAVYAMFPVFKHRIEVYLNMSAVYVVFPALTIPSHSSPRLNPAQTKPIISKIRVLIMLSYPF